MMGEITRIVEKTAFLELLAAKRESRRVHETLVSDLEAYSAAKDVCQVEQKRLDKANFEILHLRKEIERSRNAKSTVLERVLAQASCSTSAAPSPGKRKRSDSTVHRDHDQLIATLEAERAKRIALARTAKEVAQDAELEAETSFALRSFVDSIPSLMGEFSESATMPALLEGFCHPALKDLRTRLPTAARFAYLRSDVGLVFAEAGASVSWLNGAYVVIFDDDHTERATFSTCETCVAALKKWISEKNTQSLEES